jgi:hypothetical protein
MNLAGLSNRVTRVLKQRAVHITLLLIVAAVLLVYSASVPELCQRTEKQFGGMVWGQHTFAEQPSYKTCLDRIW